MREIKFRAWQKEENKMYECVSVACSRDNQWISMVVSSNGYINNIESPYVLMQYTGLKDRNGNEIYEGDIVEFKDYSGGVHIFSNQPITKDVVKWNKETGGYKVRGMGFRFNGEKYEVIGNIYENPELIEQTV